MSLHFHKAGDWDGCALMFTNLQNAPTVVRNGLRDIAESIIVPALDRERRSGNFAPNAPATVAKKGFDFPWVDGTQDKTAGDATVVGGGSSTIVMLDGDQDVVGYANYGTRGAPERPLFKQAWDACEADVEAAIDALLASAIEGGYGDSGGRLRTADNRHWFGRRSFDFGYNG